VDETGYEQSLFHSFSNVPDSKIIIFSGQVHIAVGFCDLALLTKCTIRPSDKSGPVRFIGIDMSAHCIAKSWVIHEMLKSEKISPESILEVWYSATWTAQTKRDFIEAVQGIVTKQNSSKCMTEEVYAYIEHWHRLECKLKVKAARTLWLESLSKSYSEICSLKQQSDMLDFAEYIISGDVIRPNSPSVCGNVTMFDNVQQCPKKSKDELIYNVVEMDEKFVAIWRRSKCLKEAVRAFLLNGIQKLKQHIVEKDIVVEFIHGAVCPNNTPLIKRLHSLKAYSVSWSNCVDYMKPSKFHQMAKQIGNEDCVHFAYSMNWVMSMKGANIIDFDSAEMRKHMFKAGKAAIKMVWSMSGCLDIFQFPPMDVPINVGSVACITAMHKQWVEWFLSEHNTHSPVGYNEESIIPIFYNPLHRANTVMNFCWTYDPRLPLVSSVTD